MDRCAQTIYSNGKPIAICAERRGSEHDHDSCKTAPLPTEALTRLHVAHDLALTAILVGEWTSEDRDTLNDVIDKLATFANRLDQAD